MSEKIKQFGKVECRILGSAIDEALEKIGQEYGVHIKRGSGSFSSSNFTLKIEASVLNDSGEVVSRESENFKRYAKMYGLDVYDLGKIFAVRGRSFKITGLNTRSSKYPITAQDIKTGKGFKFPVEQVKMALRSVA